MSNFQTGHIPTRATSQFMSRLLSDSEKYSVVDSLSDKSYEVDLGKPWQVREYQNNETYNTFWGEPGINFDPAQVYTYNYRGIDWGISFHFAGRRYNTRGIKVPGKKYGSNIAMDRLYYILVNKFNNGQDFVATYLQQVAPHLIGSELAVEFEPFLDSMFSIIGTGIIDTMDPEISALYSAKRKKSGELDRRSREVRNFEQNKGSWKTASTKVENMLKEGFKSAMLSGQVPLNHKNSYKTNERKATLFGGSFPEFVASEQFIKSIVFSLRARFRDE